MKNNLGFILQARSRATRFPNKVIRHFYNNECILEIIIKRLKENFDYPIIVATTKNDEDLKIKEIALKNNSFVYLGDEEDVLKRFIEAAEFYKIEKIIRICSDNPFLDMVLLKEILHNTTEDYDYITHTILGHPSMKTHYGIWCEYVKAETLIKVSTMTDEKIYREHVTNYIYSNPTLFKIKFINADYISEKLNGIRLTVDTQQDFEIVSYIYTQIVKENVNFTTDDISNFFAKHQNDVQNIKKIMLLETIKNSK